MGCELAIVGGGPAGMAAAATAASLDLDTVLLDEQSEPGGQIYRGIEAVQRNRAGDLKVLGEEYAEGAALAEAFRASGCAYEPGSTVWQARGDGVIGMSRGGASRMLPAQCILLATGAMERPVPIPGWTLPGVMGAGAAQSLLKAPGLVPDGPVVIVGAGPLIYLIAAQFVRASVPIAAVLVTAPEIGVVDAMRALPGALGAGRTLLKGLAWLNELRASGVHMAYDVVQPLIEGSACAEAVTYMQGGTRHRVAASLVLLHNGVIPATQLAFGAGCTAGWDAAQRCWRPESDDWGATNVTRIAIAGDGAGILGAKAAACLGRLAALDAAVRLGKIDAARRDRLAHEDRAELSRQQSLRNVLDRLFPPALSLLAPGNADDIVCRCEEITVGEVEEAVALGSTEINRVKAFTRCGMGPCQGRMCGPVVAEVMARTLKQPVEQVGRLRTRLPARPVPLAELAQLQ